jgi:hypothetical protein
MMKHVQVNYYQNYDSHHSIHTDLANLSFDFDQALQQQPILLGSSGQVAPATLEPSNLQSESGKIEVMDQNRPSQSQVTEEQESDFCLSMVAATAKVSQELSLKEQPQKYTVLRKAKP